MAALKECKNCKAQNDIIANNCAYCDAPIPVYEEKIKELSDSDIIDSTSKWVALFIEDLHKNSAFGANSFFSSIFNVKDIHEGRAQLREKGAFRAMKESMGGTGKAADVWDGKTAHYTTEEIKINTSKCMSILISRMATNTSLAPIHANFKSEIEKAENKIKNKIKIGIGIAIAIFIFYMAIILTAN
jgi:hypothetical protein|tara:strand:- start:3185 stop:3745 length:561 start_codon:yes stop_codon:yes gene_type:complete